MTRVAVVGATGAVGRVMMKLLRGGFTGVAKAEAKKVPGFGQFFQIAGVAFIERGDIRQAKQALEPAVAKVRDERISLVIAPEGTRSATPRLGRFKKGAFHIAMQAEVPIVPIVIRNAGEVMWRGSQTLHGGTVEVTAQNSSSHPNVFGHDWYLYQMDYQFSYSPIAHSGMLGGSAQVNDTLTVSGVSSGATPSTVLRMLPPSCSRRLANSLISCVAELNSVRNRSPNAAL